MTGQQMADRVNGAGFGFRVERPVRGWATPWIAVDKQTGQAIPMTHHGLLDKYQQLFGLSDAARTLGRRGGLARTPAKAAASRENGRAPVKPGSRPRGRPKSRNR